MENRYDIYEFNQLHMEALREEADRERLAKEAAREPGLMQRALNTLFGNK
jgi:hypothetical protein